MELRAEDLRCNNYVHLTKDDFKTVKVYQLDAYDIYKLSESDCFDVKPIPLTEEWLLKLGWEYYKPLNHYRIVIDDIWFKCYIAFNGIYFTFVNLNEDEVNHMPKKRIDYVHNLQNLFKELKPIIN